MNRWLEWLRAEIAGKRVLILGFGREGRSSLKRILAAGGFAELAIADQAEPDGREEAVRQAQESGSGELAFFTGPEYQSAVGRFEVVFKSPGIVLEREPQAYGSRTRITSQAELFLRWFGSQTVGITGTKGKSTTTTLLYHILKENGIRAVMLGNIGIPAFDLLEEITPETVAVFEFSCHQLEYNSCSPHAAVYLNLYEEHLDHYGTFERYRAAKENIFLHQKAGDVLYCGLEVRPVKSPARVVTAYPFGQLPCGAAAEGSGTGEDGTGKDGMGRNDVFLEGNRICYGAERFDIPAEEIRLHGHHNWFDIAVAYAAARDLGVEPAGFSAALRSYRPLPHRLEYVGTYGGVRYFDDSISTICETAIQALMTLPDAGSILIGGMDRGIDYTDLIHFLADSPVPHIILMEATGERILEEMRELEPELAGGKRVALVKTLRDAVRLAKQVTEPGSCCILSPAAASYGIFRNFEERGDRFLQYVKEA